MNRTLLVYFFILYLLCSKSLSQGHVTFKHLTVEDGLSQSSVTCIFQDSKGFMWFGTQDGLNRFDGYNFKIFKNIPSDSTSLTNNFIFSIYENKSGIMFIETQSGILHQYNPELESFSVINKDNVSLKDAKVSSIGVNLLESSGIQWTGGLGSGTGLKRVDTNTGKNKIFKNNPRDKNSLSDDKVYSVFRDRKGNLWIGTLNGLDRFDERTGRFIHYKKIPTILAAYQQIGYGQFMKILVAIYGLEL